MKWLVWLFLGWTYLAGQRSRAAAEPMPQAECAVPQCGGAMRVVDITFEPIGALSEHALAYLDSG